MKHYIIVITLFSMVLNSCGLLPSNEDLKNGRRRKDIKRTLVAKNGGEEFIAEMSAVLNARKFTRYLEDDINYAIDMYDTEFKIIIDSLNCGETEWRDRHFAVINQVYHLETLEKYYSDLESVMFARFLYHPKDVIAQMSELEFNDSDFWTQRLSNELNNVLADSTITSISVTNLAISNCSNCMDTDEQDIADFVDYLERM